MSAAIDTGLKLIRDELLEGFSALATTEALLQTGTVPRENGRPRRLTLIERTELAERCAAARTVIKQWAVSARHRATKSAYETAELLANTAETATLRELFEGINKLVAPEALR